MADILFRVKPKNENSKDFVEQFVIGANEEYIKKYMGKKLGSVKLPRIKLLGREAGGEVGGFKIPSMNWKFEEGPDYFAIVQQVAYPKNVIMYGMGHLIKHAGRKVRKALKKHGLNPKDFKVKPQVRESETS